MQVNDEIVIVGSARTPIGGLLGMFANINAKDLGAHAIKAALKRSELNPNELEEVLMGCVYGQSC